MSLANLRYLFEEARKAGDMQRMGRIMTLMQIARAKAVARGIPIDTKKQFTEIKAKKHGQ